MSIEIKSTGTLIDEAITTSLKVMYIKDNVENTKRYSLLVQVIVRRLENINPGIRESLDKLWQELSKTLENCWDAQEEVMKYNNIEQDEYDLDNYTNCALAAIKAQKLNAQRNRLIRQIDELLGEQEFTQLGKSYDR